MSDSASIRRVGREVTSRTDDELREGGRLRDLLVEHLPAFGDKWDVHLPVFLTAPSLARLLWLDTVYRLAIDVPGRIVEFGSQWGASFNTLLLLKLIHEPWNAARSLVSFSTFEEGFVSVHDRDGATARVGDYRVGAGWAEHLDTILETHAQRSPVGARSNFAIVPGDVRETFANWLADHPEAIISHAHFDLDVYEPTRDALELCLARMPKGAVLIFDELNHPTYPGETQALDEVLGVAGLRLRKAKFQPYAAYCVVE